MHSPPFDSKAVENVVLVVCDSLRADTAIEYMPYLQSLADRNARFRSCYSAGPHTPASMTGMVQSRQPVEGGYGTVLPSGQPTIAELLAADGVACGGWHCNPHTIAERDFDRGFDVYADLVKDPPLHDPADDPETTGTETVSARRTVRHTVKEVADRVGVRDAVDWTAGVLKNWGLISVDPRVPASETIDAFQHWLSETDHERRFAYLHLMDTHMPYKPPDSHWSRSDLEPISSGRAERLYQRLSDDEYELSDGEIRDLRHLYRAEAEFVDREVEGLVDYMRNVGLWESTLFVFTSDHGELFGERKAPDGAVTGHPSYLCEEVNRVPLVVAGDPVSDVDESTLVSGIDLGPTVASSFGAELHEEWDGVRIGWKTREAVVSSVASPWDGTVDELDEESVHVAVRSEDRAVLWWVGDHPTEYYRRSGDGEIEVTQPDSSEYESLLARARSFGNVSFDAPSEEPEDTIAQQRLKDLGYMNG